MKDKQAIKAMQGTPGYQRNPKPLIINEDSDGHL
jgi:hypothetical protein